MTALRDPLATRRYISGPMRGHPQHNYPLFLEVEDELTRVFPDDDVLNPARNFNGDSTLDFRTYLEADLIQVISADEIVLLPGWEDSEGANHEVAVATWLGKTFRLARPVENTEGDRSHWHFMALNSSPLASQKMAPASFTASLIRTFGTGATRDSETGKLDYEGFLSPLVLEEFARYMDGHRVQSDGSLRDSDNWQKGMPREVYMKSMFRHFMDVWKAHRGLPIAVEQMDALMALMFNVQGYAFELLREQAEDRVNEALEGLRRKLSGEEAA